MAVCTAFISGFIFGVISFAITFNIVHKKMLESFMKATDDFCKSVINMFKGL